MLTTTSPLNEFDFKCAMACDATSNCTHWKLDKNSRQCSLIDNFLAYSHAQSENYTSGNKLCSRGIAGMYLLSTLKSHNLYSFWFLFQLQNTLEIVILFRLVKYAVTMDWVEQVTHTGYVSIMMIEPRSRYNQLNPF